MIFYTKGLKPQHAEFILNFYKKSINTKYVKDNCADGKVCFRFTNLTKDQYGMLEAVAGSASMMDEPVLYKPGELSFMCDVVPGAVCSCNGKPFSEYYKEGYRVMEWYDVSLQITEAEKAYYIKPWEEITEDSYYHFLECMPPENWHSGIFRLCERTTGTISLHCAEVDGKFYKAEREIYTKYPDMIAEIRKQVNNG